MSSFPSPPSRVSDDKSHRVTLQHVRYEWTTEATTYSIHVEEGFRYRPGVSVRLGSLGLIDLFAPSYALEDASLLHDWCYKKRAGEMPRRAADRLLLSDPKDPLWVRWLAYVLVRLFGWTVW